jgi:hypothetical protein
MMCICELNECKLYLEQPITLPCGSTICKEHIDHDHQRFRCSQCNEEHIIPPNGFKINKQIAHIIENGYHLNETQKIANNNFKKLESVVGEYDNINSDELIYDYFSQLRNKVDLRREKSFEEISNRSEEVIQDLYKLENELKLNATKLEKMNLEDLKNLKIPLWRKQLRKPANLINEIQDMINDLNKYIDHIQFEINDFNTKLFLNKNTLFITQDDKQLGKIIQIDRNFGLDNNNTDLSKALSLIDSSKSLMNQVTHKFWDNSNKNKLERNNFLGKIINYIIRFARLHEKPVSNDILIDKLSDQNIKSIETSKNNHIKIEQINQTSNQASLNYFRSIEQDRFFQLNNQIPRINIRSNNNYFINLTYNIKFINNIYNKDFDKFLSSGLNAKNYLNKRLEENIDLSMRSALSEYEKLKSEKNNQNKLLNLFRIMKKGSLVIKKCVENSKVKRIKFSESDDTITENDQLIISNNNPNTIMIASNVN